MGTVQAQAIMSVDGYVAKQDKRPRLQLSRRPVSVGFPALAELRAPAAFGSQG